MNKDKLTYTFFACIFIGLLCMYLFSVSRNNKRKVDQLVVQFEVGGNEFLTRQMVDNMLIQNDSSVKNVLKSSINLYSLRNKVLSNPFVESAVLSIDPKGVMNVKLKQREPVVRIVDNDKGVYMDKSGVLFPLSKNYSSRVLFAEFHTMKDKKKVLKLVNYISSDSFFKKEVTAIKKTGEDFVLLLRNCDVEVCFGDVKSLDVKFNKLKYFFAKLIKDNLCAQYSSINLKYQDQVVCTKH